MLDTKIGDFVYRPDCRYYSGYKPCRFKRLCKGCGEYSPMTRRILIINLDAMGDVLMTTAMLKPLKRKYGEDCHITWITLSNALPLLMHNPLIDKQITYDRECCMILQDQEFDAVFNCDKSENTCALLNSISAKEKYGFGLSEFGTIVPVNEENAYNFELGLNDDLKFKENTLVGTQILHKGMGLEFKRDPYILEQSDEEKKYIENYRKESFPQGKTVIGINTGCSELFPNKKLSIDQDIDLCRLLQRRFPDAVVALVGGKAETERNTEIAHSVQGVLNTPCTMGLRRGIGFIDLCDILITGDTLASHIAIGLGKFMVMFFGLSCPQEIDLYDNGVKVIPDLDCAPCWKRECDDPKCIIELDLDRIIEAVNQYFENKDHVG